MKRNYVISAVASLMLIFDACSQKGAPIVSLSTPHFVPQSPPDSLVETGIRQDPTTGGIFLQWYKCEGATGYKVYRSDSLNPTGIPFEFELIRNLSYSGLLSDTNVSDQNSIKTGVRYYYYLVAYTSDGEESTPSDTVNYELILRPSLGYPITGSTLPISNLSFSWQDYSGGGYTVIRVVDITDIPPQTIWVTRRFQIFQSYINRPFDFDSTAVDTLTAGHSYDWRVERFDLDGSGRAYQGATSVWGWFTLN
ncbi:MAG: hypothetical protein M1378_10375 [Bacteroidetes bacterium]|nr:hypothetical protein [Bacteroidota bacterium]